MNINTRIGAIVIILALVLLFIITSFSIRIAESVMSQCVHADSAPCSLVGHIPIEFYAGVASVVALVAFGAFLIFKARKHEKFTSETSKKIKETEKGLDSDENVVYQVIINSGGAVYQSEIVEKSGFSKVKVTRILDKLEGKGLIERRRRGMTNILMLKASRQ